MGGVAKEGVEGHIRVSLKHLGPDAFHCNGAQLANTAQQRRNPLQTTRRGGEGGGGNEKEKYENDK